MRQSTEICRDDAFLATAAHELRTPLAALTLQLRLVRDLVTSGVAPPSSLNQALAGVEARVARMIRLVEDLTQVSTLAQRPLRVRREGLDLSALVRDAVSGFAAASAHPIPSLCFTDAPAIFGRWDPRLIEQIVNNLLSNAIKFGAGQPVQISVARHQRRARICVRDQGTGVAAPDRERIFERFARGQAANGCDGLGVGLWMVRKITEALGGTVALERCEGSTGSTFLVELPIEADASCG